MSDFRSLLREYQRPLAFVSGLAIVSLVAALAADGRFLSASLFDAPGSAEISQLSVSASASPAGVQLSWDAVPDAASYLVFRETVAASEATSSEASTESGADVAAEVAPTLSDAAEADSASGVTVSSAVLGMLVPSAFAADEVVAPVEEVAPVTEEIQAVESETSAAPTAEIPTVTETVVSESGDEVATMETPASSGAQTVSPAAENAAAEASTATAPTASSVSVPDSFVKVYEGTATSFLDATVPVASTAHYRVLAVSADGAVLAEGETSIVVPAAAPAPVIETASGASVSATGEVATESGFSAAPVASAPAPARPAVQLQATDSAFRVESAEALTDTLIQVRFSRAVRFPESSESGAEALFSLSSGVRITRAVIDDSDPTDKTVLLFTDPQRGGSATLTVSDGLRSLEMKALAEGESARSVSFTEMSPAAAAAEAAPVVTEDVVREAASEPDALADFAAEYVIR